MNTKICSKCLAEKPISEFYPNNTKDRRDKTRSECMDCTKKAARASQAKRTEYMRKWRSRQRG